MKDEENILTIGQAAIRSKLSARTIRYYEKIGIIKPVVRGSNRYRGYSEANVQTLCFVRYARSLAFGLKDVVILLNHLQGVGGASSNVRQLALRHVAELDQKLSELAAIRETIAELAGHCPGNDQAKCPIIDELWRRANFQPL